MHLSLSNEHRIIEIAYLLTQYIFLFFLNYILLKPGHIFLCS